MAALYLQELHDKLVLKRDITSSDPRVGSARDNATTSGTTSTVLHAVTASNSGSIIALLTTLVPVLIFALICTFLFLCLRRKYPRVYLPRTTLSSLESFERSPELPTGWFNWIKPFYQIPDTFVLNHSSLDAFLFLRYLKVLCVICLVGCILMWPILLPLHVNGGGGLDGLDCLSYGNVTHSSWLFAHAFLAWIFFGFILYMVSRECIYYINLRQAYLLSPFYAKRLSSRTVLFTCVPQEYLDEAKLKKVFGDSVKNVWIPRDSKELERLVKEREQTASRLERAEILLIKMANEARAKAEKLGHLNNAQDLEHHDVEAAVDSIPSEDNDKPDELSNSKGRVSEVETDLRRSEGSDKPDVLLTSGSRVSETGALSSPIEPDVLSTSQSRGSEAKLNAQSGEKFENSDEKWDHNKLDSENIISDINGSVASQWIPHESRPSHRPLANYFRRVDTIKWTRNKLKEMRPKIAKMRRKQRAGKGAPIPAAFIEFVSQSEAQSAYQTLSHHRALHMSERFIGVRPYEIVWSSLRLRWWERIVRGFSIMALIAVTILFWSIPCAIIGLLSNITYLADNVSFLSWINKLPSVILGLLTGLLPAVALSFLMSLVPAIMRVYAKIAGVASLSRIELFTQNAYFAFQVVQVFLVTTLTSAASAAVTSILENPTLATSLLSKSLPTASNFYISYFLIQGLGMSASGLVQVFGIIRYILLQRSPQGPRLIMRRWHKLKEPHWGGIFPVFTNLGVIAITYSCIAPIILGFACVGLFLVYNVYRYNLIFVYDSEIDTRGLVYPRALKQTLVGLYLAEVCMIGLFGVQGAVGPVFMMLIFTVFTALIHISLKDALDPLLYNLPRTLAVEDGDPEPTSDEMSLKDNMFTEDFDFPGEWSDNEEAQVQHGQQSTRAIEGASTSLSFVTKFLGSMIKDKVHSKVDINGTVDKLDFWSKWISPDPAAKANFLIKWLHPEVYSDYSVLRLTVPSDLPEPVYEKDTERDAYFPPCVRSPAPKLWIPRDKGGVSRQEVAHSSKVISITDEGAYMDEKTNRIVIDHDAPSPILIDRTRY